MRERRLPPPADAAGESEVVITMVTDLPALLAVIAGRDGLAGSIGGSTTLIEMSTVGPAAVSQLVPLMPDGVGLLVAPRSSLTTIPRATRSRSLLKDAGLIIKAAEKADVDVRPEGHPEPAVSIMPRITFVASEGDVAQ